MVVVGYVCYEIVPCGLGAPVWVRHDGRRDVAVIHVPKKWREALGASLRRVGVDLLRYGYPASPRILGLFILSGDGEFCWCLGRSLPSK